MNLDRTTSNSSLRTEELKLDRESMKAKLKSLILRTRLERDFAKQRQAQTLSEKKEKLRQLTQEFDNRLQSFIVEVPVRKYAPYMRTNDIPSYLMVLQSKVLRNLHQLCVVESQKKVVKRQCEEQVVNLRKEMAKIVETKAELEVRLLTAMARMKAEEDAMHKSYESVLSQQRSNLGALQESCYGDCEISKELNDELDDLIDAIANESVEKLLCKMPESPTMQAYYSPRKAGRRALTLEELLKSDQNHHVRHGSIADTTDDDSSRSSRMSLSAKMSQSFSHLIWKEKKNSMVSI